MVNANPNPNRVTVGDVRDSVKLHLSIGTVLGEKQDDLDPVRRLDATLNGVPPDRDASEFSEELVVILRRQIQRAISGAERNSIKMQLKTYNDCHETTAVQLAPVSKMQRLLAEELPPDTPNYEQISAQRSALSEEFSVLSGDMTFEQWRSTKTHQLSERLLSVQSTKQRRIEREKVESLVSFAREIALAVVSPYIKLPSLT